MKKYIKRLLIKFYMFSVLFQEKVFQTAKCNLRYLLIKKKKSKKLLVIFSGYPGEGQQARYNYILKFSKLRCHRLYILDNFGPDKKGAWYLGENMDFYIEDAVVQLIDKTLKELGLTRQDVITCGSSKGGYAALYFENKHHYYASISGAPQPLLGDYLDRDAFRNIFEFIAGKEGETRHEVLNNLIYQAIKQKRGPNRIFVHVSKNEHTYENYIVPLLNFLEQNKIEVRMDYGEYMKHDQVGFYFPPFALRIMEEILNEDFNEGK
ncbi:accessory Sec system protein Asp2 [Peribacillus sp. SI8-4]|uniref:accessory Sec system protein Asp2 n=1 Tax=Peribacillus sp. SI8-4 TaxID=3048009 RepID=UPI002556C5A3|nr:accessory Sec system protein Asp2 [Peribacillus sp. SI8-4]